MLLRQRETNFNRDGRNQHMNYQTLTAVGLAGIGLVASGAVSFFTLRRVEPGTRRQEAARWLAAFGLFLCTFLGATALVGDGQIWLLMAPLAGIGVSLDALHRIGVRAGDFAAHRSGQQGSEDGR